MEDMDYDKCAGIADWTKGKGWDQDEKLGGEVAWDGGIANGMQQGQWHALGDSAILDLVALVRCEVD